MLPNTAHLMRVYCLSVNALAFCFAMSSSSVLPAMEILAKDQYAVVQGRLISAAPNSDFSNDKKNVGISEAFAYLFPVISRNTDEIQEDAVPQMRFVSIAGSSVAPTSLILGRNQTLRLINGGTETELFVLGTSNYSIPPGHAQDFASLPSALMPHVVQFGTLTNSCEVFVHDNRLAAITSDNGWFQINDVPYGKWQFCICLRNLGVPDTFDLTQSKGMTIDEQGIQTTVDSIISDLGVIRVGVKSERGEIK